MMLNQLLRVPTHHQLSTVLSIVGGAILLSASIFLIRWRHAAKKKLEEIKGNVPPLLLMTRVKLTDEQRLALRGGGDGGRRQSNRSNVTSKDRSTDITTNAEDSSSSSSAGENAASDMAHNLDLAEGYVEKMRRSSGGIEVMSLGEYLSSLRPAGPAKAASVKDVELLLGAALLRLLGPAVGTALLPVLGVLPGAVKAAAGLGGVAVAATAVGTGHGDEPDKNNKKGGKTIGEHLAVDTTAAVVRAVGGLSILGAAGAADLAAAVARARSGWDGRSAPKDSNEEHDDAEGKAKSSVQPPTDPLVIMRRGETAQSTFPSLPNPFIMPIHWEEAIRGMEDIITAERGDSYKPDEHAVGDPTPVRDMLLPDLHIGVGGIRCTHTNREILENRLLSIILNRLATVDILNEIIEDEEGNRPAKPFVVKMKSNGKPIYRPDELIQALMDDGHRVDVCVTTRITTFGLRLSVKDEIEEETNGKKSCRWIHIPLGFDLRTGIQHPQTGRNISAFITHGAVDLTVRGPLIRNVRLQYYHNQEGFDGWSSGHYPEAHWAERATGSRKIKDPVRAIRLAGLLSCCENSVGSKLRLPLGGYGLTGCCTDSAAAVEFALNGKTGIYPCLGIGAYKSHVVRRADKLRNNAEVQRSQRYDSKSGIPPPSIEVLNDAAQLRIALQRLPSDVHPVPSTEADTARRILESCAPDDDPPFQLMDEERNILQDIAAGK